MAVCSEKGWEQPGAVQSRNRKNFMKSLRRVDVALKDVVLW